MHPTRTHNRTSNLAQLAFISHLVLILSLFGCTSGSRNITDAQGRANLQVPATDLNPDGCPDPKNLKLKDSQGKQIEVTQVIKQADGTCRAIAR